MLNTDDMQGLSIGMKCKDCCYECKTLTQQKLISFNKWDNPVWECMSCGHVVADEINEQDGI